MCNPVRPFASFAVCCHIATRGAAVGLFAWALFFHPSCLKAIAGDPVADNLAVVDVVKKYIEIFSSVGPADRSGRVNALKELFVQPDPASPESNELLYFGPDTLPVATDVASHVDNLTTAFEFYRAHNATFAIVIKDIKLRVMGTVAVVTARTSSNVTYPDNTSEENPGRWTLVLVSSAGNKWRIAHEHISFFQQSDDDGAKLRVVNELIEQVK